MPSEPARCGARKRSANGSDGSCRHLAGYGTDHPGYGQCKFHGGATPNGEKHAAKLQAIELGATMNVEPHAAILQALGEASWWRDYCRGKVAALEESEIVVVDVRVRETPGEGGPAVLETVTTSRGALHLWARELQSANERVARLAKTAIDAGVDERRVRVLEEFAADIASTLGAILAELRLTPEQEAVAKMAIPRHLRMIESGRAS